MYEIIRKSYFQLMSDVDDLFGRNRDLESMLGEKPAWIKFCGFA